MSFQVGDYWWWTCIRPPWPVQIVAYPGSKGPHTFHVKYADTEREFTWAYPEHLVPFEKGKEMYSEKLRKTSLAYEYRLLLERIDREQAHAKKAEAEAEEDAESEAEAAADAKAAEDAEAAAGAEAGEDGEAAPGGCGGRHRRGRTRRRS